MVYSKYAGTEVQLKGEDYVLLKVVTGPGGPGSAASVAQCGGCECMVICEIARRWIGVHAKSRVCQRALNCHRLALGADAVALARHCEQEDDVIGLLAGDDIAALRPLQDRVLIEVVEAEGSTAGGLLLTEGAQERPTVGMVRAVGPGREGEDGAVVAPSLPVGSTVLYQKYSGTEFDGPGERTYVVVRAPDVLAELA